MSINEINYIFSGVPVYVKAGENATLTSCSLPKSYFIKDSSNAILWRGPEGNVLLPGSRKYDMRLISGFESSSGSDSDSKKAELTISNCEWRKDSGDYTLSLVSSTSEDTLFLFTITLFVRCKNTS